jgi:hypothetical protein
MWPFYDLMRKYFYDNDRRCRRCNDPIWMGVEGGTIWDACPSCDHVDEKEMPVLRPTLNLRLTGRIEEVKPPDGEDFPKEFERKRRPGDSLRLKRFERFYYRRKTLAALRGAVRLEG